LCYSISYNQQSWDAREQVSKLLSFSLSFFLLKLSSKKKTKNKIKTLQRSVGQGSSVLPAIIAASQVVVCCRPSPRQRVAGHHRNSAVSCSALLAIVTTVP